MKKTTNSSLKSRPIICSSIDNHEFHTKLFKQQLNSITKFFANYAIIIAENDSEDDTTRELIYWTEDRIRIHVNEKTISQINLTRVPINILASYLD
jgi:hypothetical protein